MSDETVEQEIQRKGLTAPRVTPADIEAAIKSEHYFTAEDGVDGAAIKSDRVVELPKALGLLTFCVLVLDNGFTVHGVSACASPENFDAELGRKIARQNAVNQVWPLLGFRLRDRLAATPASFRDRVRRECDELDGNISRLDAFIVESPTFEQLPSEEQTRLKDQSAAMKVYSRILHDRIDAFTPAG